MFRINETGELIHTTSLQRLVIWRFNPCAALSVVGAAFPHPRLRWPRSQQIANRSYVPYHTPRYRAGTARARYCALTRIGSKSSPIASRRSLGAPMKSIPDPMTRRAILGNDGEA